MNCKKCGSPLAEGDQFCKNCGATVNAQENQIGVQSINNQPNQMQQPIDNQQQMTNMQQNYSNNSQNSWQNNYNPTPNFQQPKSNGKGKYVIIGVAIVVVIFAAIFGISMLGNKNIYGGGSSSGGITNNSTYTVKFSGFTFKIPTNLIYDIDYDTLYIGDEDGTWEAAIGLLSGSFSQLQTKKNQLISTYQQIGYGASNVNQKTYGGLDFITIELTYSGQNTILGFAKANSMYVFGTTVCNLDNDFDYNLLTDIAKVLSTAEYSGETNYISGFNKVDMGPISELAK